MQEVVCLASDLRECCESLWGIAPVGVGFLQHSYDTLKYGEGQEVGIDKSYKQ